MYRHEKETNDEYLDQELNVLDVLFASVESRVDRSLGEPNGFDLEVSDNRGNQEHECREGLAEELDVVIEQDSLLFVASLLICLGKDWPSEIVLDCVHEHHFRLLHF